MQPTEAGAEIALDPPVIERVPITRLDSVGFGAVVWRVNPMDKSFSDTHVK
jgi:hypothetical protein